MVGRLEDGGLYCSRADLARLGAEQAVEQAHERHLQGAAREGGGSAGRAVAYLSQESSATSLTQCAESPSGKTSAWYQSSSPLSVTVL